MLSPRPTLQSLIDLSILAGREIMAVHDAGFEKIDKADGSPVTIADQRAEAVILNGLKALTPTIPVLAEEESAAGRVPMLGEQFYCVDPLDGTRDFIESGAGRSNGEFTVNIALIEHGAPILGVVFAPAKNALYAGDAAAGHAFKGEWDGRSGKALRPLSPINVLPRSGAWRVTASRRSGGPKTQSFLDALGAIEEKPSSSSVKFGLIAEGAVDLYPRIGEVSEWDAAAGHAVLKAAGGGIMRLTGEDVRYGRAGWKFIIDGFVAYGDAASEAAARAILERFKWTGV